MLAKEESEDEKGSFQTEFVSLEKHMFRLLSDPQKFQSGSDLWVLFFEPDRKLFKHINWRTGFLLQTFKDESVFSKPVMIDTYKIFPNKILLCLPFHKDTWFSDIYRHWRQLDKPSLRIFAPLESCEEKMNKNWPQKDLSYKLSYYREIKR